jgi:hypothetical protein
MINSIQLLRNIGLFDSVSTAANIPLARLTLVYAENGRGKTIPAAILRSLTTGNAIPIAERRRVAGQGAPHVVLECYGGPPAAMFQISAWNRTLPKCLAELHRPLHRGSIAGHGNHPDILLLLHQEN